MEEEKAAAYYDELTRIGDGAARFKQGLGFSSSDDHKDAFPERGSALLSSSSFLSSFVRASSPSKITKLEKESQLQSIQDKLKKKPEREPRVSESGSLRDRSPDSRRRSRSRSRSRERYRDNDWERGRRKSRSRSRSRSPRRETKSIRSRRSRSRSPRRERISEKKSLSISPLGRRRSEREGKATKERNGGVDYSRLIDGYEKMSAAERVKAKMKLQLAETARKDPNKGMGSRWERFDFDKDAPLDDVEVEAAGDDAAVLKLIGYSFRFSAIEARREEQIKTSHDEAIFGSSTVPTSIGVNNESEENEKKDSTVNALATSLLNEKVLAKQPGSWRDRVRKA